MVLDTAKLMNFWEGSLTEWKGGKVDWPFPVRGTLGTCGGKQGWVRGGTTKPQTVLEGSAVSKKHGVVFIHPP